MAPRRILQEDSTDSESDSSESSSSSAGSGGGGVAPTPGRGIGSDEGSPPHATPGVRSRSGSPQSSPPPHSQSSKSPQSDRSSRHSSRHSSPHSSRPSSPHSSRPSSRHSSRHSSKHSSRHSSRRSSYSARSHSSARSEHSEGEEVGEEAEKGSVRERRDSSAGSSKSGGGSSKSGGGSSASSRSASPANEGSPRPGNKSPSRSPASRASGGSHSQPPSPASQHNNDDQKTGTGAEDSDVDETKKQENGEKEGSVHSNDSNAGSPQSDNMDKAKKRKAILSSDESDGEDPEKDPATAEALFGDADDISSDEERNKDKEKLSDEEEERERDRDSDEKEGSDDEDKRKEEGEKEEEVIPETRIDVEIPKIVCDIGRELHFVKLPNFLSVDTRPFSAETYEDEIDEEETLDEEGRARLKLKVENTMRWREALDKEGNTIKESNTRLVRWSDGSMSLHLGSEIFDVYKQPPQGDHNHLFIRQGTGLQGQAVFRTKLTFRPHSTESFTHRKMTLSLADRSQKSSGIKVLSQVGYDPDQHRGEMIKKEEERLRASLRRESKAKRVRERGAGRNLNASYLEPDREDGSDDDGAISLNAIKDKYNKKGSKNESKQNIYSSEDDGSDLDTRRGRKLDPAKTLKALRDSDDEEEGSRDETSQHSDHNSAASDDS